MPTVRSAYYSANFRCEGKQTIPLRGPLRVHRIVAELNGRHAGNNLTEPEKVIAQGMWIKLPRMNTAIGLAELLADREEPLLDDYDEPILDDDGNPRTHQVRGCRLPAPLSLHTSVELQLAASLPAREALPKDWYVSVVLQGEAVEPDPAAAPGTPLNRRMFLLDAVALTPAATLFGPLAEYRGADKPAAITPGAELIGAHSHVALCFYAELAPGELATIAQRTPFAFRGHTVVLAAPASLDDPGASVEPSDAFGVSDIHVGGRGQLVLDVPIPARVFGPATTPMALVMETAAPDDVVSISIKNHGDEPEAIRAFLIGQAVPPTTIV